jgi:hypothetical protein
MMEMELITKVQDKVEYDRTWCKLNIEYGVGYKRMKALSPIKRKMFEQAITEYADSTNHETTTNLYYNIVVDGRMVGGCKIRTGQGVKCLETLYIKRNERRRGYQRQAMEMIAPLIDGVNLFDKDVLKYSNWLWDHNFTEPGTDPKQKENYFFRPSIVSRLVA